MAELTNPQVITITRAAVLLSRFGHVLSDHDQQLIVEIGRRFQRDGRATFVTGNEWPVLEEAVGAMDAVRADTDEATRLDDGARAALAAFRRLPNTVAEDAAGVRAGLIP